MFQLLNNIPQVTRNLLILNVLMFILTEFFLTQHMDLRNMLAIYPVNSPLFEPYQIVSHFFMHADFMHLFMNMFGLVMFGSFMERIWGSKRFFIFYVSAALGSWVLSGGVDFMQVLEAKQQLLQSGYSTEQLTELNYAIKHLDRYSYSPDQLPYITNYFMSTSGSSLGASGAIFGILAGFAILFPNTEMMILFIPFPIKAKYLIGGYVLIEAYQYFHPNPMDHINHLAHLGGAITGAIIVLLWRKNRTHFY